MEYINYDMNAYNLHIIKTDKFKTITVSVLFRRKVKKEEITIRNALKSLLVNGSYNYPSEREIIIQTEKLYDLKLSASNYRIGNYSFISLKIRFLNEIYTEKGMNEESIKFLLDLIFNPRFDMGIDKCKEKLVKHIKSLSDDKIKYSLIKVLEHVQDRVYSYNSYGYLEDIDKITLDALNEYYDSVIKNDIIDVFVVGSVSESFIKRIFKENFKALTYHKNEVDLIVPELNNNHKVTEYVERDNVNQTQLVLLYSINGLTERERRYVIHIYSEMLGGSANSILFNSVREKNSYAYYVNSFVESADNIMMIYAGIDGNNQDMVKKLIDKEVKNITKGKFDNDKLEAAKKSLISGLVSSEDSPMGIMNNCLVQILFDPALPKEKIKIMDSVTRDEIIAVSKKISLYSSFVLEAADEKDRD